MVKPMCVHGVMVIVLYILQVKEIHPIKYSFLREFCLLQMTFMMHLTVCILFLCFVYFLNLLFDLPGLSEIFSSKVTMEYQLPFASQVIPSTCCVLHMMLLFITQKLQIANECSVSAISSLASASQEVCVYVYCVSQSCMDIFQQIVDYFKIHGKTLQTTTSKTGGTSSRKASYLFYIADIS